MGLFVSWAIWRALQTPFVAHPLFRRSVLGHRSFAPTRPGLRAKIRAALQRHERGWLASVGIALGVIVIFFGVSPLLLLAAALVGIGVFVLIPLTLLLAGTFYGLAVATHVSDAIAVEKLQGRHIFMALTPYGLAGTAWALGSITLHTHPTLRAIRHNLLRVFGLCLLLLGLVTVITLIFFVALYGRDIISVSALFVLFDALILGILVCVDYGQSTVTGCLVGMIAPEFSDTRSNARNYALSLFFGVQFTVYLLIAVSGLLVWVWVYSPVRWPLVPTFPVVVLAIFTLSRDAVIAGLWLAFARYTNTPPADLELVTRVDIRRYPLFVLLTRVLGVFRVRAPGGIARSETRDHAAPPPPLPYKRYRGIDVQTLQAPKTRRKDRDN